MASRKSKVFSLSLAQGVLVLATVGSGMVFARELSVKDYGTYLQTFLAYEFAVPILTLGLPSALYYFLPQAKEEQKGLVIDNLFLLFLSGLIFSLFLFLGGGDLLAKRFNNPDLSKTLEWMVLYPIYTFPVLAASAIWISKDKVKLNAAFNASKGIILTTVLILVALYTEGYKAPTLTRIFLPVAFLPAAIFLIFRHTTGNWRKPKVASLYKMLKFSIPLGLASIFGTLALQLASVIVSFLTTPKDFAIYANGAKEVPFIGLITGSISVVIMADMSKSIKEGNILQALNLFRKAAIVSASFLFPIMTFLFLYAESFIEILYSNKYSESVLPFRIYLLIIPIRIAYYGSAFIALGRTKSILFRSILDLILTGIFCYIFVSWLGAYGAAIGLILTLFLWSVPFNVNSLSKSFKCKPTQILPFKKLGEIFSFSIIAGILPASLLYFNLPSLLGFSIGIFVYSIVYFFIAYKRIEGFREFFKPFVDKVLKS